MSVESKSPFHQGEQKIQLRLGVREQLENQGQRVIRTYMPDEHRAFYAQLPFLLLGSVDESGRPWATVLIGRPGFAQSPDPQTLEIAACSIDGDPLADRLVPGSPVGLLGIEFDTRRRNRLTGQVLARSAAGLTIRITQAFGNCPQYIQSRHFEFKAGIDSIGRSRTHQTLSRMDGRAEEIITKADSFYIATHYAGLKEDTSFGADVSHRGGKPGFVRVDDERTLTFPDFTGNFHFNTIGNIVENPLTGLLFIDFDNGDLLYMTGSAEIVWDSHERFAFLGAERLVSFVLDEGVLIEDAMPMRWTFDTYSPSLDRTGSWQEVAATISAQQAGNSYINLRVTQVQTESDVISSFYLEPEDGQTLRCHKAGQFLPIEIDSVEVGSSIRRTYTISNAPNGSHYRLSIKREFSAGDELPPGVASNYFHDQVGVGSLIRAMSPRGKFVLDDQSTRPIVLISAGVGITPMISMLEELAAESEGCGCVRPVWFIHGAQSGRVHAFGSYIRELAHEWPCLNVHVRYSEPSDDDVLGRDYDSTGRVDIELLKSLLPLDNYEYYFCGPLGFMEGLYEGLMSLDVSEERIHYEFFGPAQTLTSNAASRRTFDLERINDRAPVAVRFERSNIDTMWEPSKGTLLDLAESEGLKPAYSCRSGICQTCSSRIFRGKVDYVESPMTAPDDGQALICSAIPHPDLAVGSENEGKLVLDL